MATINHSAGADIIVPNNNGTTYRGLGGDDTYILSNSIAANAAITIVDTSGANKIQLVDGLSVASTKFAADAVQLTLSNGAVVTINGASNFDFDLGGNSTAGTSGSVSNFAGFAAGAGVASLPASGSVAGASNVTVNGTSWSGVAASYSYTVSKDASQISEGESVTYTVTANSAVTSATSLTWTAIGSNNGSTVDKASATDIDAQSGSVTIAAGSSSATFSVTAIADSIAEGIEGLQISVFSPDSATVGTSTILVTNSGASSSSQTFNGSTGVDNFVGASGADTFDFSTTGELNDVDTLEGGAGSDILSITNTGATLTPNIENIETVNVTGTGNVIVNLANTASTFNSLKSVSSASNDVTFSNLGAIPGKVGITNGDGDLNVSLKAAAVSGDSDSITIELSGAGTDSVVAITTAAAGSSAIESATINSISAANTLATLSLDGASSLTVTGDQSLILTQALATSVTTINASAMTGAVGLSLTADPAAAAVTITGSGGVDSLRGSAAGADNISAGAGNDTITFATDGQLTSKDVVEGGAGTDDLVTANAATVASVLGGVSGVEKLSLTGSGATLTLTEDVGPSTFDIGNAGNQTVTLNDAYAQATTVDTMGDAASGDTIINNSSVPLTVVALNSDLSAADGATALNDGSNVAANVTTLTVDSTTGMSVGTILTVDTGEKIEVTAVTNSTTVVGTRGVQGTTAVQVSDDDVITFDTNTALTVTGSATAADSMVVYVVAAHGNMGTGTSSITSIDSITFNGALPITGSVSPAAQMDMGPSNTPVTVVNNLSALDGTLTLDFSGYSLASAAASGVVTYTGSAGVDNIRSGQSADIINTGAGNDIINLTSGSNIVDAGTGVDTINLGSGVDNISAGAGNDTISASATALLANDTIDGGAGVDTLTFAASSYADESVFGGVTGVEKIKPIGGDSTTQALTLNGNIDATIFDLSDDSNATVTFKAGYTNATTVDLGLDIGSNTDGIINGGTTGANIELTVNALDADSLDSTTTITGGTGTDTINITNFASGGTANLTKATYIDVVNVIDYINGADVTLTLGTNGAVSTPLTINGTTLDAGEVLTVAGANSLGALTINAGKGADILTGGNINDVIFGGDGADTIDGRENSATKGADNISGGAGNDIINVTVAETEFSNSSTTALVTDTVDGGAGTDTLAFAEIVTLTKAELGNISNVEKLTLTSASTITLSDEFLTANPGVALTLAAGTIKAGAGTTADPIITLPVSYTGGSGNIKITTGTADDVFNTSSAAVFDASDTIDGGAGSDTIQVFNEGTFGTSDVTGDAVTVSLDIYHTNIEKILVVDAASDDSAGDVTINIAAAFTGLALTIDSTALDQNALSTAAEILTVVQATTDIAALTITSGNGPDDITSGAGNDIITTAGGADDITSSAGEDVIVSGAGNDIINAGAGRDSIDAGDGNDLISVTTDADFEVSGGTETIDGGAGLDTLIFNSAAAHDLSSAEMGNVKNIEVISFAVATDNNATVIGLSDTFMSNNNDAITILANPQVAGTSGTTNVNGSAVGTGAIRMILQGDLTNVADTLTGGAGDDVLQIGNTQTGNSFSANGVDQELEANDVFTGNGGIDTIEYHNVGNQAATAAGNTATGGSGDITTVIDFDNITGVERIVVMDPDGVIAGGTADPITTTIEALTATATKMPATFEYDGSIITDAADTQNFNYDSQSTSDNDLLTTDFTITTGAAGDSVGGSGGDDIINLGLGDDYAFGGGRSDTIDGGAGADTLAGGDETALTGVGDSLSGGAGADTIDGGAGADTILGGDGADNITGGTGADILTGGSGADTFNLPTPAESGGSNLDTITDFAGGTGGDSILITVSAAQIDAATDLGATEFAATDKGDVSTFAEVEAVLSKKIGEAVFVKDSGQLVIDINGDSNINASDIRINLTGATAYDDADVRYAITGVGDESLSYTLGDGIDTFIAPLNVAGGTTTETVAGGGGADTITTKGIGASVITGGAGNDIIDVSSTVGVLTVNNSSNIAANGTSIVVDEALTSVEVGSILVDNDGGDTFTVTAVNTGTKTLTVTRGTGGVTAAQIDDNATLSTVNEGVDIVTGGAGNDTITFNLAVNNAGEAGGDRWVAVGATAAAPYVATNNGTDTVTFDGGAKGVVFDLDPLSSVVTGTTGVNGWLTVKGTDGATDTSGSIAKSVAAENNNRDLNGGISFYDHDTDAKVGTASPGITAADVVGYIDGTDTYSMTSGGAGVLVTGSGNNVVESPVQIWWIDSNLDGDGTDVTLNDVKLLVESSANLDIDAFVVTQFLVA